jgi:hypothetical protein
MEMMLREKETEHRRKTLLKLRTQREMVKRRKAIRKAKLQPKKNLFQNLKD